MTNSHKNVINPFLESSTLLVMTFPEIVESKDRLWGRTCAVDNVRARRKGVLGKLYEIQISSNFTWKGSSQFPEISQLFWHGICSALEYGQEIARTVASSALYHLNALPPLACLGWCKAPHSLSQNCQWYVSIYSIIFIHVVKPAQLQHFSTVYNDWTNGEVRLLD